MRREGDEEDDDEAVWTERTCENHLSYMRYSCHYLARTALGAEATALDEASAEVAKLLS